jgi:hypothetical protein
MSRLACAVGAATVAALALTHPAHAGPGFGSSQSGASFDITTISTAAPDVVRTVAVTCPKQGKLWAIATGRMSLDVTSNQFAGTVV